MIEICVNGDPPNEQYAGICVKEPYAPAWQTKHDFKVDAFRTLFNDFVSHRYIPSRIFVTGPVNNAVCAGFLGNGEPQIFPNTVLLSVPVRVYIIPLGG